MGGTMHNDLFDIKQTFHVDCFESVGYEDDDFYVYLHFRNDTGYPFYVGKGKGDRAFRKGSSRTKWWNRIVNKHGYTVKVIENFKSNEQAAFEFEKELMAMLRDMGFELVNLTDGGEGTSGYKFTEEQKKRMSEAQKRPEVRKKISDATRGENHHNFGKPGEQTAAFKGFSVGINKTHFVIFAGAKEAKACGFDSESIYRCISGKTRTHKKFTWSRHETLNPSDFAGLIPFNELSAERLKNSQ